jgi:NADPH2:quinone reductase
MRAWRVHELGEPEDVLQLDEVDPPAPGPGQVVIDVVAAAMNFPDILVCRGQYQEKPPLPFTPGIEVAGVISAVGPGVTNVVPGQRVVGSPVAPHGGLSEQTVARAERVFAIPDAMPFEPASGLQVTYKTGVLALHRRAHLQPGETLLVHAGAGGVGSAAIQLGLVAGARVIATAGGPDKVEVCRKLGAEVAIDYLTEDFVEIVKEATGGDGADVIYDPVGGDVFERSTKCIAFEGRLLVIGFTSGRFPEVRANHVLVKNYSVVGVHFGLYSRKMPEVPVEVHDEVVRLYMDGRIDPLVGEVVPMEEAPRALTALGDRSSCGKVVVRVAE